MQVLGLDSLISIDPDNQQLPPKEVVTGMSKAIGLAVGALRDSQSLLVLNPPDRRRQALRWLPAALWTAALFLVAALAMTGTELWRGKRLDGLDKERQRLAALDLTREIDQLNREVEILQEELAYLGRTSRRTAEARIPGWIIGRFESRSGEGIHDDYYLDSLKIEEGGEGRRRHAARRQGGDRGGDDRPLRDRSEEGGAHGPPSVGRDQSAA